MSETREDKLHEAEAISSAPPPPTISKGISYPLRRLSHLRESSSPSHSDTYEDASSDPIAAGVASSAPRRGSSAGPPEVSFVGPFP